MSGDHWPCESPSVSSHQSRSHFGSSHFGSSADPRSCVASTGWLKAPRFLGRLPPTMVWDQARAKQLMNELQGMMGEGGVKTGRGDRRPKQQPQTPGSRRDRAAQNEGWHCTCGFYNFSHRSVCFSCKKAKAGGRTPAAQKAPNPEAALRQQIKAATEEPVKEALPRKPRRLESPPPKWIFFYSLSKPRPILGTLRPMRSWKLFRQQKGMGVEMWKWEGFGPSTLPLLHISAANPSPRASAADLSPGGSCIFQN